MQVWFKVKSAAKRQEMSDRTMRELLKKGLRHVRLPAGGIRIKDEWLDEYFESFEVNENQIDNIVEDVLKDLN